MKNASLIAKFLPLLFSIGAFAFFAAFSPTFSPQVASAKALTPSAGCWGITCAGKDPTAMGCAGNVHFLPYKTPEYYQPMGSTTPILVGDFSSVYSNACNSNWNQAELNGYALSQGWRVSTLISTVDSTNQSEQMTFPTQEYRRQAAIDGISPANANSYAGATGWPTVTNMVDGTNQTTSTFYLYNSSGNLLMTSPQIKQ